MTISNCEWECVNENGIISVNPPPNIPEIKGLGTTLFQKLIERGNGCGQIDGHTGKIETYDKTLQKSVRTAIAMRSRGITHEHVVANCSFMHLDSCIPVIAGSFLGAKIVNFDPTIAPTDIVHLLKQVPPNIMFVDAHILSVIEDTLQKANLHPQIVVFGESDDYPTYSEFLKPSPEETDFVPFEVRDVHETAAILFSSGTSGLAKGICLSHYALLAPKLCSSLLKMYVGKIYMSFAPSYYWISSLSAMIIGILIGATRVLYTKFEPDKVWHLLDIYKVNMLYVAPTQLVTMCNRERPQNIDLTHLQHIAIGGGPVPQEQMEKAMELFDGPLIGNYYGSTELAGNGLQWCLANDYLTLIKKPEAAGRPAEGFTYKIVDPETEEVLGAYQKGELRIKTDFKMNCYFNQDTVDAWDSEGFLKTGDIAYYDDEYCFYVVDRIKEMLKFHGWYVYPAKLEALLLTHPAVESAVVFGVKHVEDGDHPMGLVVLKKSCLNSVTEKELQMYVDEQVDHRQKLRAGVKIVSSIPVNVNGKYNRRYIRDLVFENAL